VTRWPVATATGDAKQTTPKMAGSQHKRGAPATGKNVSRAAVIRRAGCKRYIRRGGCAGRTRAGAKHTASVRAAWSTVRAGRLTPRTAPTGSRGRPVGQPGAPRGAQMPMMPRPPRQPPPARHGGGVSVHLHPAGGVGRDARKKRRVGAHHGWRVARRRARRVSPAATRRRRRRRRSAAAAATTKPDEPQRRAVEGVRGAERPCADRRRARGTHATFYDAAR